MLSDLLLVHFMICAALFTPANLIYIYLFISLKEFRQSGKQDPTNTIISDLYRIFVLLITLGP